MIHGIKREVEDLDLSYRLDNLAGLVEDSDSLCHDDDGKGGGCALVVVVVVSIHSPSIVTFSHSLCYL